MGAELLGACRQAAPFWVRLCPKSAQNCQGKKPNALVLTRKNVTLVRFATWWRLQQFSSCETSG
jgi:hypothetical protein